jgi:hypothetical protein
MLVSMMVMIRRMMNLTQHTVYASPETQDIFLSIALVSSEIALAAVLFSWISLTIV